MPPHAQDDDAWTDRRTRGAERNDPAAATAEGAAGAQLLPDLDPGVTLLSVADGRGLAALHSLVLDHLLTADGDALWVDAEGYATTTSLARLAPSRRLLDRIRVARGFTPYGHHAALDDLADAAREDAPALVVAPAVDARYRDPDGLTDARAETLLARGLARLARLARERDLPVLLTRTGDDDRGEAVARAADRRLRCEPTPLGPRFVGDDFETLVYPVADGAYQQTTLAYWRRVLDARARRAGAAVDPDAAASASGPAATAPSPASDDGPRPAERGAAPSPLLDAWAGAGAGGR